MTMSESCAVVPCPGSVVLIASADAECLLPAVVIGSAEDTRTVVPLSDAIEQATEWDLFVPAKVLGYQSIAEVWNYGSVLPEQIVEVVAHLPTTVLDSIRRLSRAAAASAPVPDDLDVGPPVLADADPRLLFQESEAEIAQPFWEPTLILAGSLTLGQLVHHRRDELGLQPAELEAVGRETGWLARLERDELDVRSALPAGALAALMRRLRIGASQRLGRIARWTMEAGPGSTGMAVARQQQPFAGTPSTPTIDEYVDAFLHELAGPED